MERYGSDKPHTGFGLEWKRITLAPGNDEKVRVMNPIEVDAGAGAGDDEPQPAR